MRRKLFPLIFFIILVAIAKPVLGNATVEPKWYAAPLFLLILVFLIGPLIESIIVVLTLKRKEKLKIMILLLTYFFFINLITVPITQFFVVFLSDEYRTNLFYIAEIFPIMIEFVALLGFITYYDKKGLMIHTYSLKYIFFMSLISNIATILMGIFLLFFMYLFISC